MPAFTRLDEIQVWQKARVVTRRIYTITGGGGLGRDFGLRDQIRRSGVSVMANIAEGFGRGSDHEFADFLNIAHGSVTETQSHLYVALDLGYVSKTVFDELSAMLDEIVKMTFSLAARLRVRGRKGRTP